MKAKRMFMQCRICNKPRDYTYSGAVNHIKKSKGHLLPHEYKNMGGKEIIVRYFDFFPGWPNSEDLWLGILNESDIMVSH